MMNKMILANLANRPVRSVISIAAVALEVTLILMIVGFALGMLHDSQSRQAGIGADVIILPPASSNIVGLTSAAIPVKTTGVLGKLPHVAVISPVLWKVSAAGTLQTIWFKPEKTGVFKLECTQFCGLQHATMKGEIDVLSGPDYARWLTEQGVHDSLAQQGEAVFRAHGCSGCHDANSTVHAPSLAGLYGTYVHLQDGSVRFADEAYIRDCILNPRSFTVAGFPPIMPNFSGQLGEDDVMKLVAYIKSLGEQESGR